MIFALMGGEIRDSDTVRAGQSATTTDTSLILSNAQVTLTDCNNANQGAISSILGVYNATGGGTGGIVTAGNYTFSGCVLDMGTSPFNTTLANVTYTYTYAGESWNVINDTVAGISEVTDWYNIFIVIGAMVVLILLTVIIITAIRGSGLMAGGSA